MIKTKCELDSEMQTATVWAKNTVAMKRKCQSKSEKQTATARSKPELQ